ncbi:MAG: tetraacyldisaccharide 4'-kinase [Bdellovibrio sp. ArHS]|uniref:tetraacyldisaccharide 4'-kinase n=1 Tax=Bdellovibrio sp. ArHS TaxID=1569284 RepID=UPI000583073F|nr:tetraacyldisaccharide 4'-kinase [Bdellovibrio sp. ArHS]KHD87820.1 MAG: tetraacyldisaccharide 4'-kinase [Bdellovibrio sp. ArHS]
MKYYLKPLSFLYTQVVGVKNSLYSRGMIRVFKAPVPVVSIGNLTVGGTGKTPITDYCLKSLVAEGKKVAVISRSYRADVASPSLVDVEHPFAARYYGDEPVLLAQSNPEVAVFVGPSKWQTAKYAISQEQFDLLIVDDGFQHRKLHRDLNIVILDATESLENYAVLPEGRARESWDGVERADVLVLSKCNLAAEADMKALESRLPKDKEILYLGYQINHLKNSGTKAVLSREELKEKNLFLVSAIARPDVFETMMRNIGEVSKRSLHYRDHHQYTAADVAHIEDEFRKSKADYLITTEKDAVKLRQLFSDSSLLWSASLEVVEQGKKGRLHELICQILR